MDFRQTCSLVTILTILTKCSARSKLNLWIDEDQIENIIGVRWKVPIIENGYIRQYIHEPEFEAKLPSIPPEVDTVNLTWEAGDELFTYWFDGLKSLNKTLLYNPLLSIPAYGIIPKGPKIFQMSIPCTGSSKGIATLVLGLQVTNQSGRPIRGSPIKMKLKKECEKFVTTTLCKSPCQNNGRCNKFGVCECTQGYQGVSCEIDMCNPSCENNGTCISTNMCLCQDGFYGTRCEKALCLRPCQNGGRCVQPSSLQLGICWCTSGFYGEACEYSYCRSPCQHDGVCVGVDTCNCRTGYTGDHCEKGVVRPRRRVGSKNKIKNKKRNRCRRRKARLAKRCKRDKKKKRNRRNKKGKKRDKTSSNNKKSTKRALRCKQKKSIKCPTS